MFRALMSSSSGCKICIIQHLVSSHSVGRRPVHQMLYNTNAPDAVVRAVKQWATSAGAEFYERGMQALVHRWRNFIANGGDYVEI